MAEEKNIKFERFPKTNNFKDVSKMSFGRLIVLGYAGSFNGKGKWFCKCSCGNISTPCSTELLSGHTKSCGCYKKEQLRKSRTTHGKCYSREHKIWASMKSRCLNINHKNYYRFGGRGIMICKSWLNSFETFLKDMGVCPDGMSIDRVDNNKGYSIDNCKWSSPRDQARNRRSNRMLTYHGETKVLQEWSNLMGLSERTIANRLSVGWDVESAISIKKNGAKKINGKLHLVQ